MKNRNLLSLTKKQLLVAVVTFSLSFTAFAGNDKADKIYAQLEANQDVFSMSLSKKMIDFFDVDVDLNGKDKLIKGDFAEGRMMIISDLADVESVKALFSKENYALVEIEDEGKDDDDSTEVSLYVDRKGKNVKEAHFIVKGDENVIVLSIFGDITVEDK